MDSSLVAGRREPTGRAYQAVSSGDARTRAFYDKNAGSYAASTRSVDLSLLIDAFAARLPPRARVLDLGSGSGRDLASFLARGMEPFGLDLSSGMAEEARRHSGAPMTVADMVALPFARAAFDGVWASASLLHLEAPGQVSSLAEVRRVLRPSGLLFSSMKRGTGDARESCGRAFSYVQAEDWIARLRSGGFEVLEVGAQCEKRVGRSVPWLTCLSRVA